MFIFIPYTLFCNTLPRVFGETKWCVPSPGRGHCQWFYTRNRSRCIGVGT